MCISENETGKNRQENDDSALHDKSKSTKVVFDLAS